ncbi:Pectate disaccharide-lyase precursor [Vibrio ruber DSM 16370]|uniref:Pectate disaccharide-lyase n=1 Tax=Vibrio ruber (strain DSM 16370 / JCM 11486 / BCRC 17186 / CECT 7878 / LMG 23124 / VR1) TaxID=1123498 RepID=A0A1R4LGX5_VIBR1|nr:exopolygalacturonate lyase [Vibrio ruber]SJN55713.1 Pectate disaccharide-lyase precursor [Vibrio ruber DSM 16370]
MKRNRTTLLMTSVLSLSACSQYSSLPAPQDLTWQAITFGQSTDLNFASTILPEKIGLNAVTFNGQSVQPGPLLNTFTIESRGGKLANSHEGVTFYYTELPANANFTLSATMVLNQLGPETGSTPNRQEGAGIMVRDILGSARLDPQPPGAEEFPAASNMVMHVLRANKKKSNGLINVNATYREGVYQPWGTKGNHIVRDEFIKSVPYGNDIAYQMSLSRTDAGYTATYHYGDISETHPIKGANTNIIAMQDPKHQYVGFFASRNAKVTISNAHLTVHSGTLTKAPAYHPQPEPLVLQPASPNQSATADYLFQSRASDTGTFTLYQDKQLLIKDQKVAAGQLFSAATHLKNPTTLFSLHFTPTEGADRSARQYQQTVTRVALKDPMHLRVNPTGSHGRLTLKNAIRLLPTGGTITLEDGEYGALLIPLTASGQKNQLKTLKAGGDHVRFTGDITHQANYWHVSHLEVAGARYIVHGSHNTFDRIITHDASDTGFQITSPAKSPRAFWASHNLVQDSQSYNNMDPSRINADGFAAKMRIGDGNTFIRCISHHNIDDGWDLFNKVEDGPNGVVTIIDSISYKNGQTLQVKARGGSRGNGFKLGGEGLPVAHIIKNNLAYQNNMDGFTDNFNPGRLTLENNVAIDNKRFNFLIRKSPYTDTQKQGIFTDNSSYRFYSASPYNDVVNAEIRRNNTLIVDGQSTNAQGAHPTAETLSKLKQAAKISSQAAVPGQTAVKNILTWFNQHP